MLRPKPLEGKDEVWRNFDPPVIQGCPRRFLLFVGVFPLLSELDLPPDTRIHRASGEVTPVTYFFFRHEGHHKCKKQAVNRKTPAKCGVVVIQRVTSYIS